MTNWRDGKPYRPNVGICLINNDGYIWLGKTSNAGPEIVTLGREWQMPQGGIEGTEDIVSAATRELWEETGISGVDILDVSNEWWEYDFPDYYCETGHKLDAYRGQKQRWVAFRFAGSSDEIDISAQHTAEPPEFFEWQWMTAEEAMERSVSLKLKQYERVFNTFSQYIA